MRTSPKSANQPGSTDKKDAHRLHLDVCLKSGAAQAMGGRQDQTHLMRHELRHRCARVERDQRADQDA